MNIPVGSREKVMFVLAKMAIWLKWVALKGKKRFYLIRKILLQKEGSLEAQAEEAELGL